MATMPIRKKRLEENLPSLYEQTCDFDLLLINVNNNVTAEDMEWYYGLTESYEKMIINKCEDKWGSCNKLLPTLEMYPNDIIITIDDDIYYPKDCIKELIEQYKKTPDCIIAHEINPVAIKDDRVTYLNGFDVKLKQKEYGKYLSNCTLFPPETFNNTDIYDYDKMIYCTNGTHDELWFWINSTLNGIKCVGLNYIKSFFLEMKSPWEDGEYKLADINLHQSAIDGYMDKINTLYGDKLVDIIKNYKVEFVLNCNNVSQFLHEIGIIKLLYGYGFNVNVKNLTTYWRHLVSKTLNGEKFNY